jgi:hypothetical protein
MYLLTGASDPKPLVLIKLSKISALRMAVRFEPALSNVYAAPGRTSGKCRGMYSLTSKSILLDDDIQIRTQDGREILGI